MAMNGTQLGSDISAATFGVYNGLDQTTPIPQSTIDAIWEAIGPKIVEHIQNNAVVTTVVTSGSSAGTYNGTIS